MLELTGGVLAPPVTILRMRLSLMVSTRYTGCVYLAQHLPSGSCYIGKSIFGLEARRRKHEKTALASPRYRFQAALRKYGLENFLWQELFLSDDDTLLLEVETLLIAEYRSRGVKLYNLTDGGEGTKGFRYTEEGLQALRLAAKNRVLTEESRAKMREARARRVTKPETRLKLSVANKGKKMSPEAIAKTREAHLGSKRSPETCARISESKKNVSAETRAKISEKSKNQTRSTETRRKTSETMRKRRAENPWSTKKKTTF